MTVALGAIGGVTGSALGALAAAGLLVVTSGPGGLRDTAALGTAAGLGGALGVVLAPIATWTLMRRIPLWRAILETALGTAVGTAVGLAMAPMLGVGLLGAAGVGVIGFVAAALRLRLSHSKQATSPSLPRDPTD